MGMLTHSKFDGKKRGADDGAPRSAAPSPVRILGPALWIVVLALTLVWSTYAWFSASPYTNVTPTAYTVSDTGSDLLISASASGPFDRECALAETDRTLYPVSTADLSTFWGTAFQNAAGIATDYADVTPQAADRMLAGSVYLQAGGAALNVYLLPESMSVSNDPQLLASLRLGLRVDSSAGPAVRIFKLDELGDTSGATSRQTAAAADSVVQGGGLVADPAIGLSAFAADAVGDESAAARAGVEPLFTLTAGETAEVRYFVYMEGCDENCIDQAQGRDISLRLAFAGTKA